MISFSNIGEGLSSHSHGLRLFIQRATRVANYDHPLRSWSSGASSLRALRFLYSTAQVSDTPGAASATTRPKREDPARPHDGRNRLTRFWTPTSQNIESNDADGRESTAALLSRAGYVRSTHAGIYQFLPLGHRVQEKIEALLDKHMASIGASKLSLSAFTSEALWERSGRLKNVLPELFALDDRRGTKFLLSPTHEEEITCLVGSLVKSYRDLPLRLYQITRKYRDERRARAGLLRTREFLMKDLYTFDATPEAALATYRTVCAAYAALMVDLRLPYYVAQADSGNIGGDLSHEYHLASSLGEDELATCNACSFAANVEVLREPLPATCPQCHAPGPLTMHRSVELAHAFYLGTKYSAALDASIDTPSGARAPAQMGCYGVGVSRLIAAAADTLRDTRGLQWPRAIAPFEAIIVPGGDDLLDDATALYDQLVGGTITSKGPTDAILDDRRDHSLGWKLIDADLVGYPILAVLGRAWRRAGLVELQCRRLGVREDVPVANVRTRAAELLGQL